jgi:hypothetical protein
MLPINLDEYCEYLRQFFLRFFLLHESIWCLFYKAAVKRGDLFCILKLKLLIALMKWLQLPVIVLGFCHVVSYSPLATINSNKSLSKML